MEKAEQETNSNQRLEERLPVDSGLTVHILCDGQEIVGTLENKNNGGLGLQVAEAFHQSFPDEKEIAVTYNMPYGLVSRRAQIRWSNLESGGKLKLGATFLDHEDGFQTDYQ